jgi:hypothetical protein
MRLRLFMDKGRPEASKNGLIGFRARIPKGITPNHKSIAMRQMGRKSRGAESEIAKNRRRNSQVPFCNGRKTLCCWEHIKML